MSFFRRYWPWLLVVLIPLWLIGVVGELMDARELETRGVQVQGRIEKAEWVKARRGRKLLVCEVLWNYGGRDYRHRFNMPESESLNYADYDGHVKQPMIEIRCAENQPELASLVIDPPDPWWVSLIIASVGFIAVSGVIWYQIRSMLVPRTAGVTGRK